MFVQTISTLMFLSAIFCMTDFCTASAPCRHQPHVEESIATNLTLLSCRLKAIFKSSMLAMIFRFSLFSLGTLIFGMLLQVSGVHDPFVQQSDFELCPSILIFLFTVYPVELIAALILSSEIFPG